MTKSTLTFAFTALLFGCSGSTTVVDASADVQQADTNSPPADAVMDAPAADGSGAPLAPPVLVTARLQTHGTMQLSWTLPDGGCDTITVQRNKDGGAFTDATTVTGVATSTLDMPGHASGTYCYKLVCTRGGSASDPSNERCVSQ